MIREIPVWNTAERNTAKHVIESAFAYEKDCTFIFSPGCGIVTGLTHLVEEMGHQVVELSEHDYSRSFDEPIFANQIKGKCLFVVSDGNGRRILRIHKN